MRLSEIFSIRHLGGRPAANVVLTDARDLLTVWGEFAEEVASNLSWREDCGLIHSPRPGHWARVQDEIRRQTVCDRDAETSSSCPLCETVKKPAQPVWWG